MELLRFCGREVIKNWTIGAVRRLPFRGDEVCDIADQIGKEANKLVFV